MKHFNITWPQNMAVQQTFPAELPPGFKPLFRQLQNTHISGTAGDMILQTQPGANFHFGNSQSDMEEEAVISIETYVPALMTIISKIGSVTWDFSGQEGGLLQTEPGTHFSIALPPGINRQYLPKGFVQFQCFIMTDFRLGLIAKDYGMIQPVVDALLAGRTGEALLLPACKTLKPMKDNLDYLATKRLHDTADRNVLYKNKQHACLKVYNSQLELLNEQTEYSANRLYERAIERLGQECADTGLTVHRLAKALHVSTRTLQLAFQAKETTFTACVDCCRKGRENSADEK